MLLGALFGFALLSSIIVSYHVGRLPHCECAGTPNKCPAFVFDRDVLNECLRFDNETVKRAGCDVPQPASKQQSRNRTKTSNAQVCQKPANILKGICRNLKDTNGQRTLLGHGILATTNEVDMDALARTMDSVDIFDLVSGKIFLFSLL